MKRDQPRIPDWLTAGVQSAEAERLQFELEAIAIFYWKPLPPERKQELRYAIKRVVFSASWVRKREAMLGAKQLQRGLDKVIRHAHLLHDLVSGLHIRAELEAMAVPADQIALLLKYMLEVMSHNATASVRRGARNQPFPLTVAINMLKAYAAGTGENPLVPDQSRGLTEAIKKAFALFGIEADAEYYEGRAVTFLSSVRF